MMRVSVLVLCLLLVFRGDRAIALELSLSARADELQSEILAITDASGDANDWSNHSEEYLSAYRRSFPNGIAASLEASNKDELNRLFRTYYNFLMASGLRTGISDLEAIFRALESKGWADAQTINWMHSFYLALRRFDDAEAFRRRHAELALAAPPAILPSKTSSGGRIVLAPDDDGPSLVRRSVDLSSNKVVIIGHPRCHFSQNAVADIEADAALATELKTASVWLVETFASMTDGSIVEWNRTHPAQRYSYIETESDWPEINYWGTPSFYFFKNGVLVKKVVGWPNDIDGRNQRKAELKAGLALLNDKQ